MLKVNSLAGLASGVDVWTTSLDENNNGTAYTGGLLTLRMGYDPTDLDNVGNGGNKVRVTFMGPPSGAFDDLSIAECYIGYTSAGSGWSFGQTPVQLFHNGSPSFLVENEVDLVLDEAFFTWDPTEHLVISYYIDDNTDDILATSSNTPSNGGTGWVYKAGNDASTESITGYTAGTSAFMSILRIEFANV